MQTSTAHRPAKTRPARAKPMAQGGRNPSANPAHPRNWTAALSIALLWLLARLPWRFAIAAGTAVGRLLYYVARERRYVVRRNLECCFPDLSQQQREQWARENFAYTGRGVAELALAWFGGSQVDRIPCSIEGLEHLQSAREEKQSVILLSGHFCCIELAARLFGKHAKMAGIYKPIENKPLLDQTMRNARERNIGAVIARTDTRAMLRYMKAAMPIWYAGDQHMKQVERVFAPFFGIPTATTTGLPRLAQLGKARVLPAFYNVDASGQAYQLKIEAPLQAYPSGDLLADVTRMNAVLEAAVRLNPTQYFWVHRRFKKIPDSLEPLYSDFPRIRHRWRASKRRSKASRKT